ncbi:MAG: pyridoxamine 5'-phosphate oxidase family protein [Deltaproteobacteria bacterium]|nr:pyridoxamine 5'-phosphate oxidase family protein [Deltaproteobacteria bacterium]MBW2415664.1 pyridoxamine 5'-phosphate oxidase family protein [Deltaproteobacteria bacterium]
MGIITEEHRNLIEEVGLCYVASATTDGAPNVSPKGSIAVLDEDHLVFAEIMSPHTRDNLQQNPQVAVFVCKPEKFQGFQFKGTAELTSEGVVFDMLTQTIKDQKLPVPPPKHAVTIRVESVRALGES